MITTAQSARANATVEKIVDSACLPKWAISSQGPRERGQGSTTNGYGPERTMSRHERAGALPILKINVPLSFKEIIGIGINRFQERKGLLSERKLSVATGISVREGDATEFPYSLIESVNDAVIPTEEGLLGVEAAIGIHHPSQEMSSERFGQLRDRSPINLGGRKSKAEQVVYDFRTAQVDVQLLTLSPSIGLFDFDGSGRFAGFQDEVKYFFILIGYRDSDVALPATEPAIAPNESQDVCLEFRVNTREGLRVNAEFSGHAGSLACIFKSEAHDIACSITKVVAAQDKKPGTKHSKEIKEYGQSVIIPRTPTVQVFFADKDFDLVANGAYTTPTTPAAQLFINQRHGYAFVYEDVDAYQAINNNFERLSDDAVRQISIQQDKTILAGIPAQVATTNQGATAGVNADTNLGAAGAPVVISTANAQSFLLILKRVLTQLNVYTEGLKVVVGPKYRELLMQTNLQAANVTGDREGGIRTGYIGPFDGMELFESTFLPQFVDSSGGNPICENVLVIHPDGLTWAMQYMLPEFIRLQNKYGTAFRGQCLWGFDVVEPTYIAVGYVTYSGA